MTSSMAVHARKIQAFEGMGIAPRQERALNYLNTALNLN